MQKIILFSNDCPKCVVLEQKLKQKNISFEKSNDVENLVNEGFMTFPVLEVEGTKHDFQKAVAFVNAYIV